MTTETNSKKNPFQKEIQKLESNNEKAQIDALTSLRSKGNEQTITKILTLLKSDISDGLRNEIFNYLFDLKSPLALEPIFDAIHDPEAREMRSLLISVLWQSSLDSSDRMIELIELTNQASFHETLEILTVLETYEGPFNEDEVFEAIAIINEAYDSCEDTETKPLIASIQEVLNQF